MTDQAPDYPDELSPAAVTVAEPPPDHITELHVNDTDTSGWAEDFTGLLYTGRLDGWFDWTGHRIELKTLTTDEELLVAQLIRQFEGGMGGMKAYATATSGLCVTAIDHQPMPVPLGEHPSGQYKWAQERFNYARRWYPPTIDAILDAYLQLEMRQREVMANLGKASAQGESATPGLSGTSGSPTEGDS
jgi:hypothetical protein